MATGGESSTNSATSTLAVKKSASEWKSNLLIIIFDIMDSHPAELSISDYLNQIVAFINAYVTTDHQNRIAILISHQLGSEFVYPSMRQHQTPKDHPEFLSGKYEAVAAMNIVLKDELQGKIAELLSKIPQEVPTSTCLSSALAKSLCYMQRCQREKPIGCEFNPRILVIKTCVDSPAQYNAIMNCIFAAQKDSVPIDSCVLWNDSSFLQQASDLTGGVYLKIPDPTGLLQYLLWNCLPDVSTRQHLCLPKTTEVDYRAACVCHSRLVETGYVCSTCLSIFCQITPICSVCQTHFKLPSLPIPKPNKAKGKKKKSKNMANST